MTDYWSKLKLNETWSAKKRFNIIMNHIDEVIDSKTETDTEEIVETVDISVSVTDGENGVGDATVTIGEQTGKTGGQGGCTVKDVPLGETTVTVTATGFEEYSATETITNETTSLTIVLTAIVDDNNGES